MEFPDARVPGKIEDVLRTGEVRTIRLGVGPGGMEGQTGRVVDHRPAILSRPAKLVGIESEIFLADVPFEDDRPRKRFTEFFVPATQERFDSLSSRLLPVGSDDLGERNSSQKQVAHEVIAK